MKRIVAILLILTLWLISWQMELFINFEEDYLAKITFILLASGSTVSALIIKNSFKKEIEK